MTPHNKKLPGDLILLRHAKEGMGLHDIATQYGTSPDHIRKNYRRLGVTLPSHGNRRQQASATGKTVIEKKVSGGEYGGVAFVRISLPRISMHVAWIENQRGVR